MTVRRFFSILWRVFWKCILACFAVFAVLTAIVVVNFSGTDDTKPYDCGLVFGAAVHKGSLAGPGIVRRVRTAVDLYKEGRIGHLYFTGGKGDGNQASEAKVMAEYALDLGVGSEALTLEENASSTWENLLFTKPLLVHCDRILGISDRYHLARIRFLAWQQGGWGNLDTAPSTWNSTTLFEMESVVREVLALLYYGIIGAQVSDAAVPALE